MATHRPHDAARLLQRLRTVARIAEEETTSWGYEAEDRHEEARADGGRWGCAEVAATMLRVALERAARCREIADTATAAADDLAVRLADGTSAAVAKAERATCE